MHIATRDRDFEDSHENLPESPTLPQHKESTPRQVDFKSQPFSKLSSHRNLSALLKVLKNFSTPINQSLHFPKTPLSNWIQERKN